MGASRQRSTRERNAERKRKKRIAKVLAAELGEGTTKVKKTKLKRMSRYSRMARYRRVWWDVANVLNGLWSERRGVHATKDDDSLGLLVHYCWGPQCCEFYNPVVTLRKIRRVLKTTVFAVMMSAPHQIKWTKLGPSLDWLQRADSIHGVFQHLFCFSFDKESNKLKARADAINRATQTLTDGGRGVDIVAEINWAELVGKRLSFSLEFVRDHWRLSISFIMDIAMEPLRWLTNRLITMSRASKERAGRTFVLAFVWFGAVAMARPSQGMRWDLHGRGRQQYQSQFMPWPRLRKAVAISVEPLSLLRKDPTDVPPLCTMVNPDFSPLVVVAQAYSSLLAGESHRTELVAMRFGCTDWPQFIAHCPMECALLRRLPLPRSSHHFTRNTPLHTAYPDPPPPQPSPTAEACDYDGLLASPQNVSALPWRWAIIMAVEIGTDPRPQSR